MKILVTGGAGFIGSHVVDACLAAGHQVDVLDDLSSGRRSNVASGARLFVHDIRSEAAADLIKAECYETIIHHAAQMDVRRSVADPALDASVNLLGLLNLMEAGRSAGLQKVLFASTGGALYGEPESGPQPENHPTRPMSPYGIAKLTSEHYLYYYEQVYGIAFVALRYGNVYGPRQNPHGEAGVVAIFAQRLLDGQLVTINGDGRQTRDYVYVTDVAQANLSALEYTGPSQAFNIGTGTETDVLTLLEQLRTALGLSTRVRHGPAKSGEQMRSVLDCSQAQAHLHWDSKVGMLEGLTLTGRWFASNWTP